MDDCDYTGVGTGTNPAVVGDSQLNEETNRSAVSKRLQQSETFQIRTLHANAALPTTLTELGLFLNNTSGDANSGEAFVRVVESFTKGSSDLLSVFEITLS
jgi:hypothetical protein